MNKNSFGFIRVASASPAVKVADIKYNKENIIKSLRDAESRGAGLVVFPELAVTSSSCGSLFYQDNLYRENLRAVKEIAAETSWGITAVTGFYLRLKSGLLSCFALMKDGAVQGIVPSSSPAPRRPFISGSHLVGDIIEVSVPELSDEPVPFGKLLFTDSENGITLGLTGGGDVKLPVSRGSLLAQAGADIICVSAAEPEFINTPKYQKRGIKNASASGICAYVYASAGSGESTSGSSFAGRCLISECGDLHTYNRGFEKEGALVISDIDFSAISYRRAVSSESSAQPFGFTPAVSGSSFTEVELTPLRLVSHENDGLIRKYDKKPFVKSSNDSKKTYSRCAHILEIQANALAKRLEHTGSEKVVLGVSGGSDSTQALLVSSYALKLLGKTNSDIISLVMPGFGTTEGTKSNALRLLELMGTDIRTIPITASVSQHFEDIGHDPTVFDVTFENAQARERTQIVMDVANMERGLALGTGDLSEGALGWCTYNGDHMSMYNVNCDIPKTLLPDLIYSSGMALELPDEALETLKAIIDTPVSPELLPPDEQGNMVQKTEKSIGPYVLHDFFLYHMVKNGASPSKIFFIACETFKGEFDSDEIKKWLTLFFKRFITQQFKRNCGPDGPTVGSVTLAPSHWLMVSDMSADLWLSELGSL